MPLLARCSEACRQGQESKKLKFLMPIVSGDFL